jgi:hypothetical protein
MSDITFLEYDQAKFETFLGRLLKCYDDSNEKLTFSQPGFPISTQFVAHTMGELKLMHDVADIFRPSFIRGAFMKFTLVELDHTFDARCFAIALRMVKAIITYKKQDGTLSRMFDGGISTIAYIFHPVCGFIVVEYESIEIAIMHSMGLTSKKFAEMYPESVPETNKQYILVVVHGAKYHGQMGPPSENGLVEGVGFVFANLFKDTSKNNTNVASFGNGNNDTMNLFFSEPSDSTLNRAECCFFDHFFAKNIPMYMTHDPIKVSSANNRVDIFYEETNQLKLTVSNLNATTRKLVEKNVAREKRYSEQKRELEEKLSKQEVIRDEKDAAIHSMSAYMKEHGIEDAWIEGRSPFAKHEQRYAALSASHTDAKNAHAADKLEVAKKINQLEGTLRDLYEQVQHGEQLCQTWKRAYEEKESKLDTYEQSLAENTRMIEKTQKRATDELEKVASMEKELQDVKAALKESQRLVDIRTKAEDVAVANLKAVQTELENANAKLAAYEAEQNQYKFVRDPSIVLPNADSGDSGTRESSSPVSIIDDTNRQLKLWNALAMHYGETFANHVRQGNFGYYTRTKYASGELGANAAATEFAYICWIHDPETTVNGMNWQQTKESMLNHMSRRDADAQLRKRFEIDPVHLKQYICSRYQTTSHQDAHHLNLST